MPLSIIYEDEQIQVAWRPGGSSFTLITFADLTARPKADYFWGKQPAERLDLDCIGFVAKGENWYPAASVDRAAQAVQHAGKPVRVGYGYSMGGYGALKHGRSLGLSHAFAVAPQISIDPADVPADQRFHRHFRPALHADMRIGPEDLAPWTTILADPWDKHDGPHMERLAAIPTVSQIAAPFMGHWAIWLLTSTAAFDVVMQRILAGDVAGLRAALRGQRPKSAIWFYRLGAAALRHGHDLLSNRLWQKAAELGVQEATLQEEAVKAHFARGRRLQELGRKPEAKAAIERGIASVPKTATALNRAGHVLIGQGDAWAAEDLFRAALQLDGDMASAHLGLSHVLAAIGQHRAALPHAERTVVLRPDDAHAIAWFARLLAHQGDTAGAAKHYRNAIRLNSQLAHAYLGLSDALVTEKQMAAALEVVRQGLEALPRNANLQERARSLESRLHTQPALAT